MSINLKFFFFLSNIKDSLSNPFARITSKKFLLISVATFFVILKLHAITPPNALIGSDAKAFINEVKGFLFTETPQGFAC